MTRTPANLSYRDVDIYPPYPHEDPRHLVGPADDGELVRVAKLDDRVVGAYRLVRTGEVRFAIKALVIDENYRGHGIGRWLLGHAIGIAELKGGRVIDAPLAAKRFFVESGFEPVGDMLRLELAPE
ncbi:MAG: GNAT family N-acetyltransferase [Gammaproteobacteria bacterium]|nr:GNAT family N-acetyltransferase [Gammaproteobacteria bacterium]MDE0442559.1 GNAT family N-acetyltransferase [Gammaproteobacteria bacterium]